MTVTGEWVVVLLETAAVPSPATSPRSSGCDCQYLFPSDTMTYDECNDSCEAEGAYMLCITDANENAEIANQISGTTWIGFTDVDSEGTFQWEDPDCGSTYTNWGSGEPNDAGAGEDHAKIKTSGEW